MGTPAVSILMFLAAAALGAVGQLLYKSGADAAGGSVASYLLNPRLLGGAVCYVAVMALFVAAFKRGGSLSVLYPIYASTFIFAALLGRAFHGAEIKPVNVAGMVLLVLGMLCMGK